MPKISSFWKLATFLSTLVILFINIIPYYREEVVALLAGNVTATKVVTPAVEWMTQWAVIVTVVVILGLIIYGIVNYAINRRRPDKPSEEIQATNALITKLRGLRADLKNVRVSRPNDEPTTKNE